MKTLVHPHILISELFAKKNLELKKTPAKKKKSIFFNAANFISLAMSFLAPYSTEHHQTQLVITSACLHPSIQTFKLPYVCMNLYIQICS